MVLVEFPVKATNLGKFRTHPETHKLSDELCVCFPDESLLDEGSCLLCFQIPTKALQVGFSSWPRTVQCWMQCLQSRDAYISAALLVCI